VEWNISAGENGGKELSSVLVEAESSQSMSKRRDAFSYAAKYVMKQGAETHFGGTLSNVNFSEFRKSRNAYGRRDIVPSANLNWKLFHLNNPRRKK
jgi:hypothetical protein